MAVKDRLTAWILFILWIPGEASKTSWPSSGWVHCKDSVPSSFGGLLVQETLIELPVNYDNTTEKTFQLYARRVIPAGSNKVIRNHVVLIQGGPGQHLETLASHIPTMAKQLNSPTAFYITDVRGSGRSGECFPPNNKSFFKSIKKINQRSPVPLTEIITNNVCRDYFSLIRNIMDDKIYQPGCSRISLYGVSFGASIVYRMLQKEKEWNPQLPSQFHAAIMDSMVAPTGFLLPENDEEIIQNCANHPFCSTMFEGDPERVIPLMLRSIADSTYNACSRILMKIVTSRRRHMRPINALRLLLIPLLDGDALLGKQYHSVQWALMFIRATFRCADLKVYKEEFIPNLLGMIQCGDVSQEGKRRATSGKRELPAFVNSSSSPASGATCKGPKSKINLLVNLLLFNVDAFDIVGNNGIHHEECQEDKLDASLTHQCDQYETVMPFYEILLPYLQKRDPIASLPLNTMTNVYFIHGGLDLMTPLKPVRELFELIQAPKKRLLIYPSSGHAIETGGACSRCLLREALLEDDAGITDECMRIQDYPLDWTFKESPELRKLWQSSNDPDFQYLKPPSTTVAEIRGYDALGTNSNQSKLAQIGEAIPIFILIALCLSALCSTLFLILIIIKGSCITHISNKV